MNLKFKQTQWEEHWSNGGTGFTKFNPSEKAKYEKAIELIGDPKIFLIGDSLHSTRDLPDLSDFWRVFDSLEEASPVTPD